MICMTPDFFQLDPSRFPRRIDLELPGETINFLERLSNKTGRSVSDLAADLLSQASAQSDRHPM